MCPDTNHPNGVKLFGAGDLTYRSARRLARMPRAPSPKPFPKGFAVMPPAAAREIQSKGGQAHDSDHMTRLAHKRWRKR